MNNALEKQAEASYVKENIGLLPNVTTNNNVPVVYKEVIHHYNTGTSSRENRPRNERRRFCLGILQANYIWLKIVAMIWDFQ